MAYFCSLAAAYWVEYCLLVERNWAQMGKSQAQALPKQKEWLKLKKKIDPP